MSNRDPYSDSILGRYQVGMLKAEIVLPSTSYIVLRYN
jgi:hypothetical protein